MPLDAPIRFDSFLRPMVWGGRGLERYLGKTLPQGKAIGETWEVSDHALHQSVVANGPLAGMSLHQLMQNDRVELLGPAADQHAVFPWLIKFLDCDDWLSVQVHPDSTAVKKLWPGEGSKTEAWFVIHAEPTSRIYAGLKPGIGPEDIRRASLDGTVAELLHSFEPQSGDCLYLPAGTVHAVGGGVILAEIQETSDATFRLFDWNRVDDKGQARKLHLEESLASIHWDYGPVVPLHPEPPGPGMSSREGLVVSPFFGLEFLHLRETTVLGGLGQMQAVIVLGGAGKWLDGDAVRLGEVWILPAALGGVELEVDGAITLLQATLP